MKLKSDEHLDWLIKNEIKRKDIPSECIPEIKRRILKHWHTAENPRWEILQMFNPEVSILKRRSIVRDRQWWLEMYPLNQLNFLDIPNQPITNPAF